MILFHLHFSLLLLPIAHIRFALLSFALPPLVILPLPIDLTLLDLQIAPTLALLFLLVLLLVLPLHIALSCALLFLELVSI